MVQISRPTSNIEDGQYTLRIGKSSIKKITDPIKGEEVEKIEFTFFCLDGESEGESFTDLTGMTCGKKSKLGKIYRAAMRVEDVPEDWDTSDLEGERFVAYVQTNDSGYPRISLDTIKPAKPKATKPVRPKRVEPDDDDESTWDDEDAA